MAFATMEFVMLLAVMLGAALQATPEVDCQALLADHLRSDLELSYAEFDQTEGQGFRVLAAAACTVQAADLIEAYIAASASTERSLRWHVAQLRGEAGQTEAALSAAESVLDVQESKSAAFRWNDHVHAYLAFLRGDRAAFEQHRAALHSASERHPGNAMNARMWDRLAVNFDHGYAEAIKRANWD